MSDPCTHELVEWQIFFWYIYYVFTIMALTRYASSDGLFCWICGPEYCNSALQIQKPGSPQHPGLDRMNGSPQHPI